MIYVEEKSFDRQIELLSHLSAVEQLNVCAWLYPESSAEKLAEFNVNSFASKLVPVTTYENGFSPVHTELVSASPESMSAFRAAEKELSTNCDSIALYKENDLSWYAATIGHEGMCLVQDQSLLQGLIRAGFKASSEAPSWW